jgi:hypothetical protein
MLEAASAQEEARCKMNANRCLHHRRLRPARGLCERASTAAIDGGCVNAE